MAISSVERFARWKDQAPGTRGDDYAQLKADLGCKREDLLTATGQSLRIYPAEDPSSWPVELRTPRRA